jgi:hypothetical protein
MLVLWWAASLRPEQLSLEMSSRASKYRGVEIAMFSSLCLENFAPYELVVVVISNEVFSPRLQSYITAMW